MNIDHIESFINELIQFQQIHMTQEKVFKVDLENMSSSTDDNDDKLNLDEHDTQRVCSENEGHYTQFSGKNRKQIDENVSKRIKKSPLIATLSPMHRGDSAKQKN